MSRSSSETATIHPNPVAVCVECAREAKWDQSYDSDSEGDRDRQRQRRLPKTKILMADGVWQISSKDKRDHYERLVKTEYPEIARISHLEKTFGIDERR